MQTFGTESEFANAIKSSLPVNANDAIRAALTAGVAAGEAESRKDAAAADASLNLRIKNWVLRDDDLPVTEIIGIVGTAATAVLGSGVIVAGAVVTALTAFATLAWKTWRKGARLSKAEIAVLGFLEINGPLDIDTLKTQASAGLDIPPADVAAALANLKEVELRDGSIVELVRQDASGRWRTKSSV